MKLKNLTPHELVFITSSGEFRLPASDKPARVEVESRKAGEIAGLPVIIQRFGEEIENLPEPQDGVVYVVSALAAQAAWAQGRNDIVTVADPVRDSEGRIIGARALGARPR